MGTADAIMKPDNDKPKCQYPRRRGFFDNIKVFVFFHSLLQLSQLLVSGYMKSSISTIERRYGFSSRKSGILAAFNEVGNTVLIVFVSFLGRRVHRPRFIGGGAILASLSSLLMGLPHFLSEPYQYTQTRITSSQNISGLCESTSHLSTNQSCHQPESSAQQFVYPLLLIGQLLLGIASVPIQPFGISYIDDHASRKNAPLYLGLVLAVTSLGPAIGFIIASLTLKLFVDIDKNLTEPLELNQKDPRWVGAWWLGFLLASGLLLLAAIPYIFFPRHMSPEEESSQQQTAEAQAPQELVLKDFLKSFPRTALRTLRSPIYLLVVLAQIHLAALVSGISTFMAKYLERQFSQSPSFSNLMMGGICIPLSVLGTVVGGLLMWRWTLTIRGAGRLCAVAILIGTFTAFPLLLLGCPTQRIGGVFPSEAPLMCSSGCQCPEESYYPVCGSDSVEYQSPCHAGCTTMKTLQDNKVNFTGCSCINASGSATSGSCGSSCSHLLLPFMTLLALTSFIASFSQTPSCMMVLRSVAPEDKSFAVGVQYMLFRVLAFLPGPVLYGAVIDSACILWGRKCGRTTSCLYYDLDLFRMRFLGLLSLFVCGALACFCLSLLVLRCKPELQKAQNELKSIPDQERDLDKSNAISLLKRNQDAGT
ncbi:solute carrier organic anion transporter family member 2B1 [Synchiropus splendidus]|uniref:solute carrier organic anion transporter family member 2B1 n=1 Tax=Synchiropus splendidus TaxID=270530 RepID=UPI00237DDD92|nr:solute carrier organic anion transporter family member 2B1 [Synchiropus splendidus]